MKNVFTTLTLTLVTLMAVGCGNVEKPTKYENGYVVLTAKQLDCLDKAWVMEARGLEEANVRSSNFGAICANKQQIDAYVSGKYKVMGE